MDSNGLLWIFQNPVNGFEDTSMDCYGVFSGRRPDTQIFIVRNGVKSAVTSRQGQNLRPIYDQIREHVKRNRTSLIGSPIIII